MEVAHGSIAIPVGTYSSEYAGAAVTLSACTSIRCHCVFQYLNQNSFSPMFRLTWTDRVTGLVFSPLYLGMAKDNLSGTFDEGYAFKFILDSAASTTPVLATYINGTTTSVIGFSYSCSVVQ